MNPPITRRFYPEKIRLQLLNDGLAFSNKLIITNNLLINIRFLSTFNIFHLIDMSETIEKVKNQLDTKKTIREFFSIYYNKNIIKEIKSKLSNINIILRCNKIII